jgi:lysozyme
MKTSPDGIALVKKHEACKLVAYPDSRSIPTIGYGHTAGVKLGDTCTQDQADAWLADDLIEAETDVNKLVTVPLSQHEFDALVDFTYNVGYGNLRSSTLLTLLNQRKYASAGSQFLVWNKAGGVIIQGLVNRRRDELALFTLPDA